MLKADFQKFYLIKKKTYFDVFHAENFHCFDKFSKMRNFEIFYM